MAKGKFKKCPYCKGTDSPLLEKSFKVYQCLNEACSNEFFCSRPGCGGGILDDSCPVCHGTLFGNDKSEVGTSGEPDCFVTTACVAALGKSDACLELQLLRQLRQVYVLPSKHCAEVLAEYREVSAFLVPILTRASSDLHGAAYREIIQPACTAVAMGRLGHAYAAYERGVLTWERRLRG